MTARFQLAHIRAQDCIGCSRCISTCPTDAIVGSLNFLHVVITSDCIGCQKCVPACPVDCIDIKPVDHQPYDVEHIREIAARRKQRQNNTTHGTEDLALTSLLLTPEEKRAHIAQALSDARKRL